MAFRLDQILRCPHCLETALSAQTVLRIARYSCRRCKGMWLDRDGLLDLHTAFDLDEPLLLGSATGARSNRACPVCKRALAIYNADDAPTRVAIDVCVLHGIWLDAGELDSLLAVFLSRKV